MDAQENRKGSYFETLPSAIMTILVIEPTLL